MKEYKIKIKYITGNSFNSHTEEGFVELTWDDMNIAKENLLRIQAHYEHFNKLNSSHYWNLKKEDIVNEAKKHPWFMASDWDKLGQYGFNLKTDEGKEFKFCPFWLGYFERLIDAEIVVDSDETKISFY